MQCLRRDTGVPLLSAQAPTWADLYLLPPLADLAAIPEGSILEGGLQYYLELVGAVAHRSLGIRSSRRCVSSYKTRRGRLPRCVPAQISWR